VSLSFNNSLVQVAVSIIFLSAASLKVSRRKLDTLREREYHFSNLNTSQNCKAGVPAEKAHHFNAISQTGNRVTIDMPSPRLRPVIHSLLFLMNSSLVPSKNIPNTSAMAILTLDGAIYSPRISSANLLR
jgi:hypothetical protein